MTLADDGLPPLREVVAAHGLDAKKSLGQNFLFDLNLTRRIARAAGPLSGVVVVEVGSGPGGLTRALLAEGAKKVISIERDERCLPALAEIAARWPRRLEILPGDALEIHTDTLVARAEGAPLRICANLPYNVATPLLTRWLEAEPWPPFFDRLTLMFQREVALRIVAGRRNARTMAGSPSSPAGEPALACCSTCRRAPSRRRRKSPPALSNSFPAPPPTPATARFCPRRPERLLANAARCCGSR